MSEVLVIDGRTRKLRAFVASATQAQSDNPYQLVLRHALDMGHIQDILAPTEQDVYLGGGETKKLKKFRAEMPVIIMGEYSARSSAGHVAIHSADSRDETRDGHRKVLIVGGLGKAFSKKGGLRVLGNPIAATLVRGPVEIEELAGAGNSNCASADAAWEGVKLLGSVDRKTVFLVEGQSDYTYDVRLRSVAEGGATTGFPAEHRSEMFSRENIVKRMVFSAVYRDLVRGRDDDGKQPSDEEMRAAAKRRMEAYLSAKAAGEERYWERLGRGFSHNHDTEAIAKMADDLGVVRQAEKVETLPPAGDDFVEVEGSSPE